MPKSPGSSSQPQRSRRDQGQDYRKLLAFAAFLILGSLPAILGYNTIGRIFRLVDQLNDRNLYFIPEQTWLLYVWGPLVVLSATLLFLSPALIALVTRPASRQVSNWVITAFGLALVINSLPMVILQGVTSVPITGLTFIGMILVVFLLGMLFSFYRIRLGHRFEIDCNQPGFRNITLSMLVTPWLLLVGLAPKFHWESFNGDGAHAMEVVRLLGQQALPFWDPAAGEVASFPGLSSLLFAYPGSWYFRLFGEYEASIRIPYILFLVALFASLLALIEHERWRRLKSWEHWLVWLALVIYTVTLGYSATYSPYSADLALPATQDSLFLAIYFGFILTFLHRETGWWVFFLVLCMTALPSALLLVVLFLGAILLLWRPVPWKDFRRILAIIFLFQLGSLALAPFLRWIGYPTPGEEYQVLGLMRRLAFLQWEDVRRVLFMVVPGGILPAFSLLAWRWQDRIGKTLSLVYLSYFLFFYIQGYTVLHHYIPAMILPLVVFWRIERFNKQVSPVVFGMATLLFALLAFGLSLPANPKIELSGRQFGSAIRISTGDYRNLDPMVYRSSMLLAKVFPYDWDPSVPYSSYGTSPLVLNYYAHHPSSAVEPVILIQDQAKAPPSGWGLLLSQEQFHIYVRDLQVLQDMQNFRPPTPPGSPLYSLPRGLIFRSVPLTNGPRIYNLVDVLTGWGFDLDPVLNRFGVQP